MNKILVLCMVMLGWGIIHAQEKTTELTRSDWADLLYGFKDTSIVNELFHYQGGLIVVNNPYVCYVEKDQKSNVAFEFCPTCIWITDSFDLKNNLIRASITTPQIPDLHMKQVICESQYPKDTKLRMMLHVISSDHSTECFLVPIVSKFSELPVKHNNHKTKGHPK